MKSILRPVILCLSLLLLWQCCVMIFNLPPYILPTPWNVLKTGYTHIDLIAVETIPTLIETLMGLFLGILFGCSAALVMIRFRLVSIWFLPVLIISQAIPTFAIAPLLVIWFGYGMASKIITTIIMLFFPITSAFYDGLRRTELGWLELAKTMNATPWNTLLHIRIPAALPSLASGIRVATVIAPIGAIVGEWVGASRGLGYLMLNANAHMQIDMMFSALLTIILISLSLYFSVNFLLKKLIPWQHEK